MTKTGRVGGSVFQINHGVTVEKQYQPIVNNPSTNLQVAQRAKMKLMSQLSAIFADELAPFGRQGLMSPRNLFVKDMFNRNAVTYANGQAVVNPANIQLTPGVVEMLGELTVTRTETTTTVTGAVGREYISRVAGVRIVVVQPTPDSYGAGMRVNIGTTVVPAANGTFTAEVGVGFVAFPMTVYAYAFEPKSIAAIMQYENLVANQTLTAVTLETLRREIASGFAYSLTLNRTAPSPQS